MHSLISISRDYSLPMGDRPAVRDPRDRARDLGTGCHWRARRHQLSYNRWNRRATWLAFGTGALGIVVGATLFSDLAKEQRWLGVGLGLLGIAAGIIQVAERTVGPRALADKHKAAQDAWENMRGKYYQFVEIHQDPSTAAALLDQLREEHAQVRVASIAVEEWTQAVIDQEGAPKSNRRGPAGRPELETIQHP